MDDVEVAAILWADQEVEVRIKNITRLELEVIQEARGLADLQAVIAALARKESHKLICARMEGRGGECDSVSEPGRA